MRKVKLISIGYQQPEHKYTQDEAFDLLGYPHAWRKLFRESGIDTRYFVIPLSQAIKLSFQEQQDLYKEHAVKLSTKAIENCLDGRDVKLIKRLVYGSCTGFAPGPTIAHLLAAKMCLSPGTYLLNNSGMGCEAAFPGLKAAYDFVRANGGQALVVNCELSSLAYWPERENPDDVTCRPDPENDFEVLRSNALFADMATAVLVGEEGLSIPEPPWSEGAILPNPPRDDWRHPEIIDTENYTDTAYIKDLGFEWRNGRLRVILSRRVPELAPLVVKPAVDVVLNRQNLQIEDIAWWVVHAAGLSVINNIGKALGLPDEKLVLSRETLKLYGNTSSTSVAVTGKRLMIQNIQPGDYVAMLSVGPGMSGGMTLLRFGYKPNDAAFRMMNRVVSALPSADGVNNAIGAIK